MIRFKSRSCYPPYSSSTCIFGWFLSSEKQHLHLLSKKKIINLSVVFISTCQEIYRKYQTIKGNNQIKKTKCWLYYLGMLQKKTLIKVYHMFVTKEEFQLHVYDLNVFIQNIQVLLFNIGQNVLRGGDSWELIKIFFFNTRVLPE